MTKNGHDRPPDIRNVDGSVDEAKLVEALQAHLPEEVLRRMNHREWLGQCALMLETQWGSDAPAMTPLRAGMISRLRLARDYIEMLEADAHRRKVDLKMLRDDLANALSALQDPSKLKSPGA